ncbi:hypothetical protein G9A89_024001 [Geosiphon pyriformis]|nr:hypothetical protein G9A89_024001 [Geosiphon pyriformis]
MNTCCSNNEEYQMATKFYCHSCDNKPCLTCGEILLDERMWNDIPGISAYEKRARAMLRAAEHLTCNLIYNSLSYMIYTIPEEDKPISSYALESDSTFNSNLNSDNDNNKNNSSTLFNLFKEQELRWFSNNNEGIMPEHVHDTNAGFDLRYPKKYAIKLEPHSHICIDLKIVLEILATTMVQLASKNSLAKKEINIKERIIDTGYMKNIIAMLQNNSEKTYIIEPNKKIAQTIFLFLVKIAQLVSMENRKELGITAREIQEFRSIGRIDVLINMAEKEVINKREIISTHQSISIPPYD